MASTPTLAGRKMLVVGASMGIGRAVAVGAVRAGAEVVLVARRGDEVASVILGILASASPYPGVGLEHIVLRSPAPVIDSADLMIEAAASRLDAGS